MGRAVAGPRVRLVSAVRVAAAVGAVVLVAGCGAAGADTTASPTTAPTTKASTAPPTTAPATTPPPTSAAPTTPPSVAVPDVVGVTVAQARATLSAAGLRWRTTVRRTSTAPPGTVIAQSPGGDRLGRPGSLVTLTVAQAPPPKSKPTPTPEPEPAGDCHPSYAGACLDPTASDYDCASGSGNGPKYTGRVTVVGPDVFDLDRDGDGIGCERG